MTNRKTLTTTDLAAIQPRAKAITAHGTHSTARTCASALTNNSKTRST